MLDHEALWTGESWPADVARGPGGSRDGGACGGLDAFGAIGAWNRVSTLPSWGDDSRSTNLDDDDGGDRERREERRARRRRRTQAADVTLVEGADGGSPWGVHVKTSDVACAQPCEEASLPAGHAFVVGMADGSSHYFVCDDVAAREGWVDALTLVQHVAARGRGEALRAELVSDATVAPQLRNKGR